MTEGVSCVSCREIKSRGEKRTKAFLGRIVAALWLSVVLVLAVFFSGEMAEYALDGLSLAVFTVLPTAIPSMVLCDLYRYYGHPERLRFIGRAFHTVYGISPYGLRAYILGNLFGFPMGAREVGIAYGDGSLSRDEAERLLPLATNPSPAFVVGAVGGAMMGDFRRGVILLLCVWTASVITGVMCRKKKADFNNISIMSGQNYNAVDSISSVGSACLTIISFISVFSVMLGICKKYVLFPPLKYLIFAIVEVTGAVTFFLKDAAFSSGISAAIPSVIRQVAPSAFAAFSLGFGGLSVMLQSAAFVSDYGLKMRRYLPVKLLQGLLSALLFMAVDLLFL